MNPTAAIIGDNDPIDLPQTTVDESALSEEKRKAKFSRTAEFKKLNEYIDQRISFYQKMLPDGRVLTDVDTAERGQQWVISNAVIGELKALVDQYKYAQEVVSEAEQQRIS